MALQGTFPVKKNLFIFAGEKSGDVYGGKLLQALRASAPTLSIEGVGGPSMRKEGLTCILPMEAFEVMGFVDVLWALPQLLSHLHTLTERILTLQPNVVLTIDYPGFCLRLAQRLRKSGFQGKICHFICPSVWAWGKRRIPLMEASLDLLFSILPFEKNLFKESRLQVEYLGHPLAEEIAPRDPSKPRELIALFPGSRKKVIQRQLPLYLRCCTSLPGPIGISIAHDGVLPLLQQIVAQAPIDVQKRCLWFPPHASRSLMEKGLFALAASGTVTLELALHHCPTIVTYALSPIDLFIARDLLRIRLPHYALPNLIAQKEIFLELFGPHLHEHSLLTACENLLQPQEYQLVSERCASLSPLLHKGNAINQAAMHILRLASNR